MRAVRRNKEVIDGLKKKGFHDAVLSAWKSEIYGNVSDAVKYYDRDYFCYQYFLFGRCKVRERHQSGQSNTMIFL